MENIKFTMAYKSCDDGYIGYIKEVPSAISQGQTLDELKYNLNNALKTVFEYERLQKNLLIDMVEIVL